MNRNLLLIFAVALLAMGMVLAPVAASAAHSKADPQKDESLRKGETRPTMDPARFGDAKVRAAYEAAREIPWVLDSIYCYCRCHENPYFRHISLLSCYVDTHAST
jgi:hypothetical protein